MSNKLLAIGIPTYKRPKRVIKLLSYLSKINFYDQIILSSNSDEPSLNKFISQKKIDNLTYYQQKNNVGVAHNYRKVVELCKCKFLHVISDEDCINKDNLILLYNYLKKSNDALIISSIMDSNNFLYKDVTNNINNYLFDVMGEVGHFGSSIINKSLWDSEDFEKLNIYCDSKGSIRVSEAVGLITYSKRYKLKYFKHHIVEMGSISNVGEIRGKFAYGMKSLIDQFISLENLVSILTLKYKFIIKYFIYFYFCHHAFHSSKHKFGESLFLNLFKYTFNKKINIRIKINLLMLYNFYLYFYLKYKIISILNFIKNKIK